MYKKGLMLIVSYFTIIQKYLLLKLIREEISPGMPYFSYTFLSLQELLHFLKIKTDQMNIVNQASGHRSAKLSSSLTAKTLYFRTKYTLLLSLELSPSDPSRCFGLL